VLNASPCFSRKHRCNYFYKPCTWGLMGILTPTVLLHCSFVDFSVNLMFSHFPSQTLTWLESWLWYLKPMILKTLHISQHQNENVLVGLHNIWVQKPLSIPPAAKWAHQCSTLTTSTHHSQHLISKGPINVSLIQTNKPSRLLNVLDKELIGSTDVKFSTTIHCCCLWQNHRFQFSAYQINIFSLFLFLSC